VIDIPNGGSHEAKEAFAISDRALRLGIEHCCEAGWFWQGERFHSRDARRYRHCLYACWRLQNPKKHRAISTQRESNIYARVRMHISIVSEAFPSNNGQPAVMDTDRRQLLLAPNALPFIQLPGCLDFVNG